MNAQIIKCGNERGKLEVMGGGRGLLCCCSLRHTERTQKESFQWHTFYMASQFTAVWLELDSAGAVEEAAALGAEWPE